MEKGANQRRQEVGSGSRTSNDSLYNWSHFGDQHRTIPAFALRKLRSYPSAATAVVATIAIATAAAVITNVSSVTVTCHVYLRICAYVLYVAVLYSTCKDAALLWYNHSTSRKAFVAYENLDDRSRCYHISMKRYASLFRLLIMFVVVRTQGTLLDCITVVYFK